jgi:HK97 family phage portal protein
MEINNLMSRFGDWLGFSSKAQEKSFFNSKTQMIGRSGAVYTSDVPSKLVSEVPELNLVITKKAEMFSNGVFRHKNKEGKEIQNSPYIKLLNKPNPFSSENEFLRNYMFQISTFGNQFIYAQIVSPLQKGVPSKLQSISPEYLTPVLTGKFFDQTDIEGIVKYYEYNDGMTKRTFLPNEIIWSKIHDINNPIVGVSPLKSLRYPITNTKLAYDYLNVISGEKGALGMLKTTSKDSAGALPLTPERKMQLENQYTNDYGVGDDKKSRIKFVDGGTEWVPMSYPTAQLLLLEQIEANKLTICDAFNLNKNIFSSQMQGFTSQDVNDAIKQAYTDAIQPMADSFCQTLDSYFKFQDGSYLCLDYDHLEVMQESDANEAEQEATEIANITAAVTGGLITVEEGKARYKLFMGEEAD